MKCIVSLTSHSTRIAHLIDVVSPIIADDKYRVVLTLHKDDTKYMWANLRKLIKEDKMDQITVDEDLGPHLKYYQAKLKYPDLPIITIDDDNYYSLKLLDCLYNNYLKHPDVINANRVHYITDINDYHKWKYEYKDSNNASHKIFATGVGGVIYPPGSLSMTSKSEIIKCKFADDIYLKILEYRKGIKVRWTGWTPVHPPKMDSKEVVDLSLYKQNNFNNRNNEYLKLFKSELTSILKEK